MRPRSFVLLVWCACWAGMFAVSIMLTEVRADATELRLRFRDEDGRAVRPSSAELLLVAWGDAVRLNLESGVLETSYGPKRVLLRSDTAGLKLVLGEPLVLPLDEAWLQSKWPERFQDMDGVYVYLQADGYVPIRSERFLWIGSHAPPYGSRIDAVDLLFPGCKPVVVKEGQSAVCELVFRQPKEHFIKRQVSHIATYGPLHSSAGKCRIRCAEIIPFFPSVP